VSLLADNEIIDKFNSGEEKAFRWLYDEHFVLLRYYGLKYLDNVEEVDDIVQEVFINIWGKRGIFHSMAAFKSYMFLSVRNQCLNRIRHQKVISKNQLSLIEEESEESILEKLVKLDVFDQLMEAFKKLPPSAKQVYWLSINGLSHNEISEKLNISVNTIKTHKNRANAFLKSELKDLFSLILGII